MIDPLLILALTTGLLGAGHCIGMCGNLVAALALTERNQQSGVLFQLLYHGGRIITYALIGGGVGWIGSAFAFTDNFKDVTRMLLVASDFFIILVGLGSAGLFSYLSMIDLEFPGPARTLVTGVRRLLTGHGTLTAFPLGLLLGLLPCGYVYAMAIIAAQTTSPLKGALIMFIFGLGTIPALLFFGGAVGWLSIRARSWMLRGAGLAVALMGLYNMVQHLREIGVL